MKRKRTLQSRSMVWSLNRLSSLQSQSANLTSLQRFKTVPRQIDRSKGSPTFFLEVKTWQQRKTRTMFAPKIHNSKTSFLLLQDYMVIHYVLIFLMDIDQFLPLKFQFHLKSHLLGILFLTDMVLSQSTQKAILTKMRVWYLTKTKGLRHRLVKLSAKFLNLCITARCYKTVTQICRNYKI